MMRALVDPGICYLASPGRLTRRARSREDHVVDTSCTFPSRPSRLRVRPRCTCDARYNGPLDIISDQAEELPRPEEFSPLDGVDVPVGEVEPDDPDPRCADLVGGKDRPVAVAEPAEVVDVGQGRRLGGGDQRAGEERDPVAEEGDV